MRTLLFVLAIGAAGCAARSAPPRLANAAPASDGYLIWTAPDQGAPTTQWVDAGGHVLGTAPGIVIADGGELWRVTTHELKTQLRTCEQINADSHDAPAGDMSTGELLSIARVAGGAPIALNSPVVDDGDAQLDWGTSVVGGVGPYLVLEDSRSAFACGAHGGGDAAGRVFDVAQRKQIAPLAADAVTTEPALHARVVAKLGAAMEGFGDDTYVGLVVPAWKHGALAARYLIWGETCYACTQGDWSSYTISDWFDGPVPAALAALPPLPPAVAALVDDREHVGVSWGHATPAWRATFH